jgi:hypothetical protein
MGKIVTLTTRNLIAADNDGGSKQKNTSVIIPGIKHSTELLQPNSRTVTRMKLSSYSANGIQPTPKTVTQQYSKPFCH